MGSSQNFGEKMESKNVNENSNVSSENCWERTARQKKFLKKPNNKTAKKQFFRELEKMSGHDFFISSGFGPGLKAFDGKIFTDLETCSKIFKVADLSKKLDFEVVKLLSTTLLYVHFCESNDYGFFFGLARHDLLSSFFRILIELRQSVIAGEQNSTFVFETLLIFVTYFLPHVFAVETSAKGFEKYYKF